MKIHIYDSSLCSSVTGYGDVTLATFDSKAKAEAFRIFCFFSKVYTNLYIYDEFVPYSVHENSEKKFEVIAATSIFNHFRFNDELIKKLMADFTRFTAIITKIETDNCIKGDTYAELQDMVDEGKLRDEIIDAVRCKINHK